jgi:uncharacterized protein YcnI
MKQSASSHRPTPPRSARATRARRLLVAPVGAAALILAGAAAASAHVTVHSADAAQGGKNATLVFAVPNEETKASTTRIEIDLPAEIAPAGVTAIPPSGWQADLSQPGKVVFSGGSISGTDEVDFPIKVATLPMAPQLVFKAIQTYSSGDVVRWIDQSAVGSMQPEHPAPTLALAAPGQHPAAAATASPTASPKATAHKAAAAASPSATAGPHASATPTAHGSAATTTLVPSTTVKVPAPPATGAAGKATATAAPTAGATASPAPKSSTAAPKSSGGGADSAKPSVPTHVHAGTGGQASDHASPGVPVLPLGVVLSGLAVAGLAVRRLARR